jgi:hypothetical protein
MTSIEFEIDEEELPRNGFRFSDGGTFGNLLYRLPHFQPFDRRVGWRR